MSDALGEAEQLAVAYAPAGLQPRYRALLKLDGTLARIALSRSEPLPAQLKLAWWRDACSRLGDAPPGPPLFNELAAEFAGAGAALVGLVDGWEAVLLAEPHFTAAAGQLSRHRAAAMVLAAHQGAPADMAVDAARVWTLATLAEHAPDAATAKAMRAAAWQATLPPLPRSLRPLAMLAGLSRRMVKADRARLLGDRLSPFAAMRLGIFGR